AAHAAARQQPVLAAALLVAAEEDPAVPEQDCGDANPRLGPHRTPEEPKPLSPRSVAVSSTASTTSTSTAGTTRSCAIRIPGSTANVCSVSVLSTITRSSPR